MAATTNIWRWVRIIRAGQLWIPMCTMCKDLVPRGDNIIINSHSHPPHPSRHRSSLEGWLFHLPLNFYHHLFCNMIGRHNLYIASAEFLLCHENRQQVDKTRRVATLRIVQTETSSARWRFNPSTLKSVYLATIFGPRKC